MQEDDDCGDLIEKAYVYLTEKRYPDDCEKNEKRIIRKKAQKFVVQDGELQYKKSVRGRDGSKVE